MSNKPALSEAREIIEDLCRQYALPCPQPSCFHLGTGGLSVLEQAFDFLGWDDPHPMPSMQCDEPGCTEGQSCGTPSKDGYRRTCGEHAPTWPRQPICEVCWEASHPGQPLPEGAEPVLCVGHCRS